MLSLRTISLPMIALVAALAGCSSDPGTSTGADTSKIAQNESTPAEDGPADAPRGMHHGPGGFGGPDFLVTASLRAPIHLTDAQRTTIEALAKGDRPDHRERPPFDATKAQTLANAIRSGSVASLPAPPAPDQAKMQAHLAESAARLMALHDTLTADQRAQLVAHIEAHAPKGPPAQGNAEMRHGPHGAPGTMFGHDLNLTDAQKEQLRAKFEANHPKPDFQAMRAEMKTKLESFKGDSFDATAFVTPPAAFQPKPDANPLADLISVLTPEQREILAKKIEAGPPAMMPKP